MVTYTEQRDSRDTAPEKYLRMIYNPIIMKVTINDITYEWTPKEIDDLFYRLGISRPIVLANKPEIYVWDITPETKC